MVKAGIFTILSLFFFVSSTFGQDKNEVPAQREGALPESRTARTEKSFAAVFVEQGKVLFQYARELQDDGNSALALEKYQEFLVLYPQHELRFHAFFESARLLKKRGSIRAAALQFLEAYKEDYRSSRGAEAYLEAARLFLQVGETEWAKGILIELTTVFPYSKVAQKAKLELKNAGLEISDTPGLDFGPGEDRYKSQEDGKSEGPESGIDLIERGSS